MDRLPKWVVPVVAAVAVAAAAFIGYQSLSGASNTAVEYDKDYQPNTTGKGPRAGADPTGATTDDGAPLRGTGNN